MLATKCSASACNVLPLGLPVSPRWVRLRMMAGLRAFCDNSDHTTQYNIKFNNQKQVGSSQWSLCVQSKLSSIIDSMLASEKHLSYIYGSFSASISQSLCTKNKDLYVLFSQGDLSLAKKHTHLSSGHGASICHSIFRPITSFRRGILLQGLSSASRHLSFAPCSILLLYSTLKKKTMQDI